MTTLPSDILSVLSPFAPVFKQKRVFQKAIILFIGTLLCTTGVTVCGALRAFGLNNLTNFSRFHRLLNRDHWNMLKGSRILLDLIIKAFAATELIFAFDDTIERRRGKKIKLKGFFKDPLGTGSQKTVTCSGLRWMPVMLLVKVPFMKRTVALPFLVVLSPSEATSKKIGKRHKSPQRQAEQVCQLLRRWYPNRPLRVVADAGYATQGLMRICKKLKIQFVTRARSNTRFFELAPPRTGKKGRPRTKGERLPSLKELRNSNEVQWSEVVVLGYGGRSTVYLTVSLDCLWAPAAGGSPIPVRITLVKDPQGMEDDPVFCLISSDSQLQEKDVVEGYTMRWSQEVTHRETREYLGMETQRQWSDLAIERSTPLLFAAYSLVFLITHQLNLSISPMQAAWYQKQELSFGDLLLSIKKLVREHQLSQLCLSNPILKNISCYKELLNILEGIGIAA